jgi:hypothetical protein
MGVLRCEVCSRDDFKRPAGLASHQRTQHPPEVTNDNAGALEKTLACLRQAGRLEPVDAATVQGLRSLAVAVDIKPFDARLWQQYREALAEVLNADGAANDDLAEAIKAIRGAA